MKRALTGARIFSGKNFIDNKALLFENENIVQLVDETEIPKDFITQNLNGGILSPGFIDLQVNGGGGKLFNNSPDKESLNTIINAHQYFGTTSIMPTVISDSLNVLQD
jgi:N-acetylglucosamine-6-phosphate deacetylase